MVGQGYIISFTALDYPSVGENESYWVSFYVIPCSRELVETFLFDILLTTFFSFSSKNQFDCE
jgi:hypothetical protein